MNPNYAVLLIEDNPGDARLVQEMLYHEPRARLDLQLSTTLADGLWWLGEHYFDAVLVDLGLPDSQGIATFTKLHSHFPSVATVVLTGNDDLEMAVRAVNAGAQDYLIKAELSGSPLMRSIEYAIERKKSEEALRRSEATLRGFYENSPMLMGVVELTDDDEIIHLYDNPVVERFFSVPPGGTVNRSSHELGAPAEAIALWASHYRMSAELGIPRVFEYAHGTPQGGVWLSAHVAPLGRAPSGRPQFCYIAEDITERKQGEMALRESEARYRSLMERAPDPIYTIDPDGVITSVNPVLVALGGWRSDKDLVGKDFIQFVHPDDVETVRHELLRVLSGKTTPIAEIRVRNRDGAYLTLEAQSVPDVKDGRTVGLFGTARDVTERRRAEAEREQLARNLELVLESTFEGICSIDPGGVCTLVNTAACQMLGFSREEILGQNFHELVHVADGAGDGVHCLFDSVLSGGERDTTSDTFLRRKDGTSFPAELSAAPMILNGDVTGVVVSFTDLTERQAMEQELERASRLSALGRMAATIAHEFNNVLMGIQPFAEIILRTAADPSAEKAGRQILKSVQRGRRVTGEVLRFTKQPEPVRRPIEVGRMMDGVMAEVREIMPTDIAVRCECEDSLVIDGDEDQLVQVLVNLAANARDAMEGFEGQFSISCSSDALDCSRCQVVEPGFLYLVVRDSGCGIPKEALDHLFEPFFTTKRKGTGLGLPLAYQVVAAHGGQIHIDSTEGEGTTIHILLPHQAGLTQR
jgi:two-component system, cell cycle sensor histidine kinase and response regulator CckA